MVLVNGMIMDRETIRDSLNDSPPWASYDLSEHRLVRIGKDAAAVVYKAEASRVGEPEPFVALMSSIYRLVDGEPRPYQQTRSHTDCHPDPRGARLDLAKIDTRDL